MAKQNDGRDAEMDALMQVEGVDTQKIAEQIGRGKTAPETPPAKTPPPATPPPATPPTTPPATPPVDTSKSVSDPETIRATVLNEMFGEQFKTVEDFKKANTASLQELATLRQQKQDLEAQLAKKPKHSFASDDIAKFNEFARETGIKDATIFNKLNAVDITNMPDIDALALQHIIENPRLASRTPEEIRRYFERKYSLDPAKIDPKKVEDGDFTQEELEANRREYNDNKMDMEVDAEKAKTKLADLKGKIKMPEIPVEEPTSKTKWTPEVETKQKEVWSTINDKMSAEFAKLPITLKGAKEPIIDFVLPEETKKAVLKNALDYVVGNQMEVSEENVRSVASTMYSSILMTHQQDIYHAIFERARSLTEDELLKVYHNPSSKNNDTPPVQGTESTAEEQARKAYEIELGR